MIRETKCYVAVCDVCEKLIDIDADFVAHYDTEAEAMEYALDDGDYGGGGCKEIDGKLACSKCWTYDDDDEIAIREQTK